MLFSCRAWTVAPTELFQMPGPQALSLRCTLSSGGLGQACVSLSRLRTWNMEVRDRRMLNTQVSEATIPFSPELPSLSKLHRQLNHKHAHTQRTGHMRPPPNIRSSSNTCASVPEHPCSSLNIQPSHGLRRKALKIKAGLREAVPQPRPQASTPIAAVADRVTVRAGGLQGFSL